MMKLYKPLLLAALAFSTAAPATSQTKKPVPAAKTPADYVDLYIGSINPKTRSTGPVIKTPGGSVVCFPNFNPEIEDFYLSDKIFGFPVGFGTVMATSGQVKIGAKANASKFDHDLETAKPYYYQALLEDPDINTEYTMTDNAIVFRFTLPANQQSNVLLTMQGAATLDIKNNKIISGSVTGRGRNNVENRNYFYAELSKATTAIGTWKGTEIAAGTTVQTGAGVGVYASYPAANTAQVVELKIGISPNSTDEAKSNLSSQIGALTFDQVKNKAKDRWNAELGLIKIKGGTERQRGIFYSTLYRTRALRMGNVWDTYRSAYALQDLIKPEETVKAIA
jgi:putative alpha-1,2-mannosidase